MDEKLLVTLKMLASLPKRMFPDELRHTRSGAAGAGGMLPVTSDARSAVKKARCDGPQLIGPEHDAVVVIKLDDLARLLLQLRSPVSFAEALEEAGFEPAKVHRVAMKQKKDHRRLRRVTSKD